MNVFRLLSVALVALLACVTTWLFIARANPSETVTISTGSPLGIYHRVGEEIGKSFANSNTAVQCETIPSGGSRDNVSRLQEGTADVAIVQNDAIANESVRSLAMLYTEVLHLVCRRQADIVCLNDLVDHPTNLGTKSGGTNQLVTELLQFSRVKIPNSNQTNTGFSEAADSLRSGDIDAAFFLVGVGAEIIHDLLADPEFELVPIQIRVAGEDGSFISERAFVEGFQIHYPHATYAEIPLMSYEGKPVRPTSSVGIGAVLACRKSWDEELARTLVQSIFASKAVLGRKISLLSRLDEESSQTQLQFPLHRGAEGYYRRNEPGYLAENAESFGLLITLALLVASGLHGIKKWIDQKRKNRVDVYYDRVQRIQRSLKQPSFAGTQNAFQELEEIEAAACKELINEQLDADHSYVILQNMISRCRREIERNS